MGKVGESDESSRQHKQISIPHYEKIYLTIQKKISW
jgi:hypothetical protein